MTRALTLAVLTIVLACLAVITAAHAELNRCTLPNGKVEYTDQPCSAGTQRTLSVTENAIQNGATWREEARQLERREAMRKAEAREQMADDRRAAAEGRAQVADYERSQYNSPVSTNRALAERQAREQEREMAALGNRPVICRSFGNNIGSMNYSTSVCR